MSERDRTAFTHFFELLAIGYSYVTVSYIALKSSESSNYTVLQCNISFDVVADEGESDQLFETVHLVAGKKTVALGEAVDIVKPLSGTAFEIGGMSLVLKPSGPHENCIFFPHYPPFLNNGPRLPTLTMRGETCSSLLNGENVTPETLDWELKGSTQPFDSISELQAYLGVGQVNLYDGSLINFYLKSPLLINSESSIEGGFINAKILASSKLDSSKVTIGFKYLIGGKWSRGYVQGHEISWSAHERRELSVGAVKIQCGSAHIAELFLNYDNISFHQWWTVDLTKIPNSRYASFTMYDSGLVGLRALLSPSGSRGSDELEHGTSILLHLLGFSACTYGRIPRLQEVPDVIAFSAMGNILLVECPLLDINNNAKLLKLAARATELREKLANTDMAYVEVLPAIVTTLARKDILGDDLALASSKKIAILAHEDIQSLVDGVTNLQPNSEHIYSRVRALIPQSKQA